MPARMILSLVFAIAIASGQTPSTQVPADHLYRSFFGHVVFLNSHAQALAAGDLNRTAIATYYQRTLLLSPGETAVLNQIAAAADEAVKVQDAKAQVIIDQIHSLHPAGQVASKSLIPQASPQLAQLWSDRRAAINAQIQLLQSRLSPATFQRVNQFVTNKFGVQVKMLKTTAAFRSSSTRVPSERGPQ